MIRNRWATGAAIALVVGLAAATHGDAAQQGGTPYEKSLVRAIGSAQDALEKGLEIWVDHSKWENAWECPSPNRRFLVKTTHSRKFGDEVGRGLEAMLAWFRYIVGDAPDLESPMLIFIVPDMTAYNQLGEDFGAYHSSKYGSFYATDHPERPTVSFYFANETLVRQWLTHGAFHQFVERSFPVAPPTWIVEGLASYFEIHWDYSNRLTGFRHLMQNNQWIALDILLEDSLDSYTDDHFTELGMLFYYLLHEREDTRIVVDRTTGNVERAPFRDYIRKVLAGQDVTSHPVHALVTEGVRDLEKALENHTFTQQPKW